MDFYHHYYVKRNFTFLRIEQYYLNVQTGFLVIKLFLTIFLTLLQYSEPVSSTAPRTPSMIQKPIFIDSLLEISLLCPAQGYPAPSFR